MKKISERALELTGRVFEKSLDQIRKKSGGGVEVGDEDWSYFIESSHYAELKPMLELSASVTAMGCALDEWQASVEERLARLEKPAPATWIEPAAHEPTWVEPRGYEPESEER